MKKPVERAPEDKTVRRLEGFYQDARDYRDGNPLRMMDRWRSHRAWYLSTGADRSVAWHSPPTHVNLIYEKCEKLFADVTEAMPTFLFRAKGLAGLQLSDHLNVSVPQVWRESEGDMLYREAVKSAIIYGTWFWKISHDPGYAGLGPKVVIRPVPMHRMFPAPFATTIQGSPGLVEVQLRTVEEVFNDYGIKVDPEVLPEDWPDISEDMETPYGGGVVFGSNLGSSTSGDSPTPGSNQIPLHDATTSQRGRTEGYVFQKEAWIMDPTLESQYWLEETPVGPEMRQGKNLRYPNGRVIGWANGKRLYDRENPYNDGKFPYVKFTDNPFPEFFWGLGEIPKLINLQLMHDDTVDTMRLVHAYMANGRLIVDETTGLRDRQIGNDPGEILWTRRGTQDRIKWLQGMTPPAEFYQHLRTVEQWFDLLTGSFDVTRGVNPTGVTAARALVALQRAAGIRIRGRMRENEDSLRDAGNMLASRIRQFAPARSEGMKEDGEIVALELSEADRNQEVDLRVDVVTNLDDLKAAEFQKMLLFNNMGLAADERLIKESGLSSTETLLAELPQVKRQQLLELLAAQVAGASAPGGGSGGGGPGKASAAASGMNDARKSINQSQRTPIGGE
jgi:hypothetical protein